MSLLHSFAAHAMTPLTFGHNGFLLQDGSPVHGEQSMTFRLYADGSEVFSETFGAVSVDSGFYSVILGSTQALPTAALRTAQSLRLGVSIGAGAELSPRFELSGVP